MTASVIVRRAGDHEVDTVRAMFREYQRAIGVDLCFQGFEGELASLPGAYSPPGGALFLASTRAEGEHGPPVGCAGLRALATGEGELKRLYVRQSARGLGAGRALFEAALGHAREAGFESIVLDTLPDMHAARAMYVRYGFVPIDAYYENPVQGAVFYRLMLR